ncbi:hypothetical protein ABZT51_50755, partial [Streptomyces sp. NPDC005373]|uniref:hypothetical protein n=1 Tax=Streptomyces sp. NPDC005373 TaxID=3156879 RepID=UPI0033A92F92
PWAGWVLLPGPAHGRGGRTLLHTPDDECFVFRPLDESACWAVAQIAHERATNLPTAHAAHLALRSGLPVLTRQPDVYKQIDARINTEPIG